MVDRVLRVATLLALASAVSMAAPRDPRVTAKPSGRTLGDPDARPVEQPDFSRPERQQISAEPTNAESDYFEAAMRGEAWAQTKIGKLYLTAGGDEARWQQGIGMLRRAAEQGDAEAIYLLATMTAAGAGMEQSDMAAFEQMKRAAELGSADAQFELASIYGEGRGVEKNELTAEKWARRAAAQGHLQAQTSLGRLLIRDNDQKRKQEGVKFLESASNAGNANASIFLASVVGNGDFGLAKDELRAEALLKRIAEQGNSDAQFVLAALYKFGDAFTNRREEAYVWLQRAASQGHGRAIEILAAEQK